MTSLVLSIIAIAVSMISAAFVIIDKFKVWTSDKRLRLLKKDKAILFPLLSIQIQDYHTIEVTKETNFKKTEYTPQYSKLYYLFQGIDTEKISNRVIAEKINKVKLLESGSLFKPISAPDTERMTVQFTYPVNEVLKIARSYLAEVL